MALTALAIGALAAARPRKAAAWACPKPQARIVPADGATAPTNVRVTVTFPGPHFRAHDVADHTRQILGEAELETAATEVVLRDPAGHDIPASAAWLPATVLPTVVVRPRHPLAPRTRYTVILRASGRDFAESRFTTADGPDEHAPALGRVRSARFHLAPRHPFKDDAGPYAWIELAGARDVEVPPLHYEVHVLAPGEAPSSRTLRAVTGELGGALVLGQLSSCYPPNFVFPRDARRIHLGIVAVDLAGNRSAAVETDLKLAWPRRARR